jgi:hypothetical protein
MTDGPLILWGRCRSGRRWFWAAWDFDGDREHEHGWADTANGAVRDAGAAVERLADGREATVLMRHGVATQRLRDVNAAKRKAQPAEWAETGVVEYLYAVAAAHRDDDNDWIPARVVSFRITRKTPKRIYYVRSERRPGDTEIGYVDRQKLEADGEVVNRSVGWWAPDFRLHAAPPELEPERATAPDVKALKAAMAAAHPDRGGTDAAFIAARERYERATA